MGRLHKRHNLKARQKVETKIDRSQEQRIEVDLDGVCQAGYDSNNPLVLPSQKRATKTQICDQQVVRKLSKKQRKKLEKIVERKDKKSMRSELLEKLQSVQATNDELSMLTSISEVHAGRTKRKIEVEETADGHVKISALGGKAKKPRVEADDENVEDLTSSSDEDEDESESDTEDDDEEETADVEVEEAGDPVPDTSGTSTPVCPVKQQHKVPQAEPTQRKPAVHISLNRKPHIEEQRLKLPILGEEQIVMEAINDNPVTIICGETGSGKTTQVPQFLYEAGYASGECMIGVTEPRRVAAISMSKRVAQEMNLPTSVVSYQIRYEGNVTTGTKIKFMTDGVLMKEVQRDFLLTKYKVIIIDEAHERSVYTDILIGLLSRIVPLRNKKGNPLKLVIMSATLRVEDFTENQHLFRIMPPVVRVESRQFPVTIHFNKRTADDYLGEAYKKACKIHRDLPEGGILVFVTGQQEVHTLCAKLKRTFPYKEGSNIIGGEKKNKNRDIKKEELPDIKLEDYSVLPTDEQAELQVPEDQSKGLVMSHDQAGGMLSEEESDEDDHANDIAVDHTDRDDQPMYVLPLYSLLSSDKQAKVFDPPPPGSRLCIVATNVAETSLTIPNIKYVIDTGKVKTKFYDKVTGVSAFKVTWTSNASGNQRAGRAGRTAPGHCYRLYSSAVFNDEFEKFSSPEITRRPVDDLVLQMKDMHIDKVVNFPFPTPPDLEALKAAEKLLVSLGALERPPTPKTFKETKVDPCTRITALGRAMACFPVSPRYGKMLSLGQQHQLLPYVVAMVAALSVHEIFTEPHKVPTTEREEEELKNTRHKMAHIRRTWAGSGNSLLLGDLMVMLKAVGAWEFSGGKAEFCEEHGLRLKAMIEIRKLRAQLTNTVNTVISDADLVLDPQMKPPTDLQAKLLRQIILAGLGDHVARRLPDPARGSEDYKKMKNAYQSLLIEDPVFIHPGSVLYKNNSQFVVFQNVEETSKLYMKGVSVVDMEWLPLFVANQCRFSKPEEDPPPRYDDTTGTIVCHMAGTFGGHFWPLPSVELQYPDGVDLYKLFARYLLEGVVCPRLAAYVKLLLTAPVTMVKSWAKLQPRTETFLNALISEEVNSKDKLLAIWKKNPKFLLKAYLDWLPQSLHEAVTQIWPPVDS